MSSSSISSVFRIPSMVRLAARKPVAGGEPMAHRLLWMVVLVGAVAVVATGAVTLWHNVGGLVILNP